MKITHVVLSLDPSDGGPPTVVSRLASAQAAQGHTVTIVSHEPRIPVAQVEASLKTIPGIDKVGLEYLSRNSGFPFPAAGKERLRKILPLGKIVHLHGMWEPIVRTAGDLAFEMGLPYGIAPH